MRKIALMGIFALFIALFATFAAAGPAPVWDASFLTNKTISEGTALSITFNSTANDSAGGSTFSATSLPTGASFVKVNDSSATLTWTPTFSQAGVYTITLNALDADSSFSKVFTVTATDSPNPASTDPAITAIGAQSVNEGVLLTIPITTTAIDYTGAGGTTFSKNVTFGTLVKNSDTSATFTWTPTFADSGVYSVNFTATDGDGTPSRQTVQITVVNVPAGITAPATVTLGGSSQRRSNPKADNKNDREINVSTDVTVTNTGSEAISNLQMTSVTPKLGFSTNDLLVSVKFAKTSLSIGESTIATITARVPERLDAIDNNFKTAAFNVATISFSANTQSAGLVTGTTELNVQAENKVKITSVDIEYADKSDSVNDGDTVKNIKPGDSIKATLEGQNKYTDSDNLDIDDSTFTFIADGLDADESEDLGALSPKEKDSATIDFDIDEDTDNDKYDADITLDARDENGARHGEKWEIQLEVKRETHEILVQDLRISPTEVSCSETSADFSFTIRNSGRNDEDSVTIRIDSPQLKYGNIVNDIKLDQDDTKNQQFTIPLKNLTIGTYRITVETYYDSDQFSDRQAITLRSTGCDSQGQTTTSVPSTSTGSGKEPQNSGIDVIPVSQPPVTTTTGTSSKGFLDQPEYVALLVAANVVVLGGAIWLFAKLFAKP